MININLLPESMRKKEGLPLPNLLGFLVMFCVLAGVAYIGLLYHTSIIPSLEGRQRSLSATKSQLQKQVEELKKLNAEIDRLSGFVNTVRGLYVRRIVWAKVLSDLKHIVNFDPAMNEYNQDMRYLWLTKISGRGKVIGLSGLATGSTQASAMQLPERFLERFRTYSPVAAPEKDEEAKLQQELKNASAEHELRRRENPELPPQSQVELAIRQRLEEIKNVKSGGIALQPFYELVKPRSLQLLDVKWGPAPKPRSGDKTQLELFPTQAWSFRLSLDLN